MQLTTLALAALSAGHATALFRRQDSQASNHTDPEPIAGSYIVEYAPVRIITDSDSLRNEFLTLGTGWCQQTRQPRSH